MIRIKRLIFLIFVALTTSFSTPAAFASELNESITQPPPLSENQIDIGRACLLFAKEAYPDLDVEEYSVRLDRMVSEIQKLIGKNQDADHRIRALNTYLYKRQGFHYDKEDPYGRRLKNRYLNGLLDSKSGSCLTMPLLYLSLSQRLGYPIYPVSAPQHLFCRYLDPSLEMQNIETTSGGGYSSDADYIRDLEIPKEGVQSGAYLETMTYWQLLVDLIAENGTYWARQGNLIQAVKYFTVALELNPKTAEVWRLQAHVYRQLSEEYQKMETQLPPLNNSTLESTRYLYIANSINYKRRTDYALQRAKELGVAPPLQGNYWMRQAELARTARKDGAQ